MGHWWKGYRVVPLGLGLMCRLDDSPEMPFSLSVKDVEKPEGYDGLFVKTYAGPKDEAFS